MNTLKKTSLWTCLGLLFIFLLYNFFGSVLAFLVSMFEADRKGLSSDMCAIPISGTALGVGLIIAATLTIIVLFVLKMLPRPLFNPTRPNTLRRWPMGIVAFVVIALGINEICEPLNLSDMGMGALFEGTVASVWGMIAIVVVGPLIEELVFRAGILRQLLNAGVGSKAAVAVSALIFGLVHGNPAQAIPAFILGLMLGVLYLKTGDIRLSLGAHILNNTLAVILLKTFGQDTSLLNLPAWGHIAIGLALVILGLILTCLWWRQSEPVVYQNDYTDENRDA